LINWLYQSRSLSQVRDLRTNYSDPHLHQRLMKVLNHRQGHHIAHELEQAKIRCSDLNDSTAVDLSFVEKGFAVQLAPSDMRAHLDVLLGRVVACARDCVQRAGVSDAGLDAIYLTGGSSALRPFQAALQTEFSCVTLVEGDLFGGVAAGLAYS
jgi:hypothetical chaperone protein